MNGYIKRIHLDLQKKFWEKVLNLFIAINSNCITRELSPYYHQLIKVLKQHVSVYFHLFRIFILFYTHKNTLYFSEQFKGGGHPILFFFLFSFVLRETIVFILVNGGPIVVHLVEQSPKFVVCSFLFFFGIYDCRKYRSANLAWYGFCVYFATTIGFKETISLVNRHYCLLSIFEYWDNLQIFLDFGPTDFTNDIILTNDL